ESYKLRPCEALLMERFLAYHIAFWMSLVIEANMILRPCCCPHATSRTSHVLRAKTLLVKSPGAACPRHSL
ncbi:UNVERIFIED_CONTAM: hypothetical protein Sindi_0481600, partial [Sesamum indicum]